MSPKLSIIIPNHNGAATLEACLQAAVSAADKNTEILVVDDCSTDGSIDIIKRFPCKLVRLDHHGGASRARNVGAKHSHGEYLFFTDVDCLLQEETLARVRQRLSTTNSETIIGGTYTRLPYDAGFFSLFQSVFINYSETKNIAAPDYLATHALAIRADTFEASGGFSVKMGPILEDVEFSHRLRRRGVKLEMDPAILVQHIFNYSFFGSFRNATRKSMFWTLYSLKNHDLLADSGTASKELKFNVMAFYVCMMLLSAAGLGMTLALPGVAAITAANVYLNRKLLGAFYEANGPMFATGAVLYYLAIYPVPVGAGAFAGLIKFIRNMGFKRRYNGCIHH